MSSDARPFGARSVRPWNPPRVADIYGISASVDNETSSILTLG